MDTFSIILLTVAILTIITGIAGMVLPVIPGPPVLFVGLLLAAWAEDFQYLGAGSIVILGLMAAVAYLVDFLSGSVAAKRYGASRRASVGAAIGALVGIFFGLPGIIIGPFAGAFIGELTMRKGLTSATNAGTSAWIGLVIGTGVKVALGFAMVGFYILRRFF